MNYSGDGDAVLKQVLSERPAFALPEQVHVLGMSYRVVSVAGLESDGKVVDGRAWLDRGVIMIRAELSPDQQLQTLWHEIVHAIGYTGRINGKTLRSERVVDYVALALVHICRDNPALVRLDTDEPASMDVQVRDAQAAALLRVREMGRL